MDIEVISADTEDQYFVSVGGKNIHGSMARDDAFYVAAFLRWAMAGGVWPKTRSRLNGSAA